MMNTIQSFLVSIAGRPPFLLFASLALGILSIALFLTGIFPLLFGDFIFLVIIAFLFSLYRPSWAFLLFVGLIPFEIISIAPIEFGIDVRPYQFIGSITVLAVAVRFMANRLKLSMPRLFWFDYGVLVFWLGSVLSASNAPDTGLSLKQSIILLSFIVLYGLVRVFVRSAKDIKKIIPFFVASGSLVSVYAILQNRYGNMIEVMPGRPNATFTEADWLGGFLMLFIGVLYGVLYAHLHPSKTLLSKPYRSAHTGIYLSALLIAFVALIISVARSAWLGAFAMSVIFFVTVGMIDFLKKNIRSSMVFFGLVAGIFLISLSAVELFHLTTFQLLNRAQSTTSGLQQITVACEKDIVLPDAIEDVDALQSFGCRHINLEEIDSILSSGGIIKEVYRNDPNVNIRRNIYKTAWGVISDHPVLGVGMGSSAYFLGHDERGSGLNASNMFLEAWLGNGLLGVIALIIVWIFIPFVSGKKIWVSAWRDLHANGDGEEIVIWIFFLSSWFGLTVFNLFNAGVLQCFFWAWLAIFSGFSYSKRYKA